MMHRYYAFAYRLFGPGAQKNKAAHMGLERDLKKANMFVPIEVYISRLTLTSCIAGLAAAVVMLAVALVFAAPINEAIRGLSGFISARGIGAFSGMVDSPSGLFQGSSPAIAAILVPFAFLLAYFASRSLFYYYPAYRASSRGHQINIMFPYAVTYMYAMCHGGVTPLEVFRSLGANKGVYGEMSEEARAIVRGVDMLGNDLILSIKAVAATTPSDPLKGFLESMVSVMESGGDLSKFLHYRIEQYRRMAEIDNRTLLDLLGLMAEVYVTAMVAGPLFIIIILVSIGLMQPSSNSMMQLLVYLLVPGGTLLFVLILYFMGLIENPDRVTTTVREINAFPEIGTIPDGDDRKIQVSGWKYRLKKFMLDPADWLVRGPERIFYVSIPAAVIVTAWLLYSGGNLYGLVRGAEGILVIDLLIAVLPFAALWELKRHWIRSVDAQIPEFLKRLASINESGLTLDKAIKTLLKSNLGVLNVEIRKIVKDLDWGGGMNEALVRFEYRVNTLSIRRVVTLITRASDSAGDINETLTIAANDAEHVNTMRAERSSDMLIYVSIIYISFAVFLYITYILITTFLPAMPVAGLAPADPMLQGVMPRASVLQVVGIKTILFHAVLLQGLFSGLIAGIMGEGSLFSGLKHSIIMILVAYAAFIILL